MMHCDRLGIYQRWPSQKTVMKKMHDWLGTDGGEFASTYILIRRYFTREDAQPFGEYQIQNRCNVTSYHAEQIGRYKTEIVLVRISDNLNWLTDLALWTRYYQVGINMKFFWHYQYRVGAPNHPNGGLKMFSIDHSTQMLGVMAILGWRDAVIYQGTLIHAALNRGYQPTIEYRDDHRRAQSFMLRLFADWNGDVAHDWPPYAYDEPIYQCLFEHWRTPNPDNLVPCLLAACDRHTHQSRPDSTRGSYDFQNFALSRVPIEILWLFRLREWQGLANPRLDHPLMAAPFDQLPTVQAVPELDDLMLAVLKRAREDWSYFDDVLALDALKKPPLVYSPKQEQSKSWLAKLFQP